MGAATVESILRPGALALLGAEPRFCQTRECDVVYYGSDGSSARKDAFRGRPSASAASIAEP